MGKGQKVRVVLMHPPLLNILEAATPDYIDENRGHNPPMGLLYLQSAIENSNHESIFLDANVEGWDHKEAARQALSYDPDLIGLQAMTFTLRDAYLVAKESKRLNPYVFVMIGGPHPTIYPEQTAALDAVDFAFAGEGEIGLVQFLDLFHDEEERGKIPGIASKKNSFVHYRPSAGLIKNLDQIPFPARHASPYMRYSSVLAERNPITIMITSRGCPFKCVFCNRMGRKYRCHSAEYVIGEIEEILKLGIKEIFLHDDTFTLKRDRVTAICRGLIERNLNVTWEARTRVDCVDEELLSLMRRAGCHRLSFGVESGSERVLKSMRKGISLGQVERVFAWCRREGIVTLADFMVGNLDEKMDDFQKTLALIKKINPDYVQFSICSPYPGTPLYELGLEKGLVPGDVWLDYAKDPLKEFSAPVWSENFSEEELYKLTAKAYRSFYFRLPFVLNQLKNVKSLSQFKTLTRAAFGILMK